ncbi:MAG: PAS domain S-box protein, partial [Rhodospirillaceae bacterium]|nr:PAS domain S-box protein [Rhodospirillaceae bacterium]
LPDAVFFKDGAHRYLKVNRAKAAALGIADPEEAVGRTDADFLDPQLAAEIAAAEDEVLRTGRPILDHINRTRTADGAERWYSTTQAPILDERGEAVSLVCVARDITERERSRQALAESERRYRALYNRTPVMMQSIDRDGRLVSVSDYWCETMGYGRDEVVGRPAADFMTEDHRAQFRDEVMPALLRSGRVKDAECRFVRKDGRVIDALLSAVAEHDEAGLPTTGFLSVIIDVTDKKALESQLLQAQKMEAMGQLTGGVAHDFNNLLTVILGNLDLIEGRVSGELRRQIENAVRAAERGAALTHRLLAFSRRQTLQPAQLDLNRLTVGMEDMLRRTLGENVEVELKLQPHLWLALADKAQVENALLNLAINSRDAMPTGGRLTIETANVRLDEDYAARNAGVKAGNYVMLAVSDTGTGMPPEVVQRAIEPFFTTKEPGKGTGLGLSMIYGFARQSDGHLRIESQLGRGTTVRLYLRPALDTSDIAEAAPSASEHPRGGETILVVEDDAEVRAFATSQLVELGYRVLEAADGAEASRILAGDVAIDLLFTDVVMPGGITARDLAERARVRRPDLKVLFTSGYTQNHLVLEGRENPALHILIKPYRKRDLALKVREVLDAPG